MNSKLSIAERLLKDFGITEPNEIDLEAIAYSLGTRVHYRPLYGCEARIVGKGDRAVITVNSRSSHQRQRFSLAHELGHWQFHRGKIMICRVLEMERDPKKAKSPERIADNYAADLLMPYYLFKPAAKYCSQLTFSAVDDLARLFGCSYTATAIRLVESDLIPGFLICHGPYGRKWFTRSPSVPDRWFPKAELDQRTHAFDVVFSKRPNNPTPYRISADAWFEVWGASELHVGEQTLRYDNGALTLITVLDSEMLEQSNDKFSTKR